MYVHTIGILYLSMSISTNKGNKKVQLLYSIETVFSPKSTKNLERTILIY